MDGVENNLINPKKITKKQHYVPQFYLKLFSDNNKNLKSLELKTNRISKPRHYSSFGYRQYYYANETGVADTVSQYIEAWLQHFEDIIAKELPIIIDKILTNQHICDDDKYILSSLMCMLWLRTPMMREQISKMHDDLNKKIADINSLKGEVRKNNANHLRFMVSSFGFDSKGFTNMFFAHKWKMHIAKEAGAFITSDNPVTEWWSPTNTFWGTPFLGRNKYFALTPEIFIELSPPKGSCKVKRHTIFNKNDNDIRTFNLLTASHSSEYIYSSNQKVLEYFALIRNTPGEFEIEHYKKYELPWEEYRRKIGD